MSLTLPLQLVKIQGSRTLGSHREIKQNGERERDTKAYLDHNRLFRW